MRHALLGMVSAPTLRLRELPRKRGRQGHLLYWQGPGWIRHGPTRTSADFPKWRQQWAKRSNYTLLPMIVEALRTQRQSGRSRCGTREITSEQNRHTRKRNLFTGRLDIAWGWPGRTTT